MIYWIWTWKILWLGKIFTGLGLIFQYVGLGLEKYLDYFTEFGLILWCVGIGIAKC